MAIRPARAHALRAHGGNGDEPLASVYSPAGGDLVADGRAAARRGCRLSPTPGLRPPTGGLSHHPGAHVLSWREPGGDGFVRYRATRAAIRPAPRLDADDLHELRG